MWKRIKKLFGSFNLTWPKTVIFAVIMGIYTALVAMLVPDGNSFHDIAVTFEWWVLPAIFIIVNCKKPLEAAVKTFVFFLISQPLIYLIQVPFSYMGWGLFGYYPHWFAITLATFPGAFLGWFIKKDKWYSAVILSVMTILLTITGIGYIYQFFETPPNHLISIIYCFGIIPVFILAIFKKKSTRLICTAITLIITVTFAIISYPGTPYETYRNTLIESNNITLVGKPYISSWSSTGGKGNVYIIENDGNYTFKITGTGTKKYYFDLSDDENVYHFEYYFDKNQNTVIVNRI